MRTVTAERECLCDSLTFSCHIHLRHLLFVELIQRQLDRTDGVAQISVAFNSPGPQEELAFVGNLLHLIFGNEERLR